MTALLLTNLLSLNSCLLSFSLYYVTHYLCLNLHLHFTKVAELDEQKVQLYFALFIAARETGQLK